MTVRRIKRNDTLPYLAIQVLDSNGDAKDLTGATAEFHMSKTIGGATKVNAPAEITDAELGHIEYHWQVGDTDTTGSYFGEFQVITMGGRKFTNPVKNNLIIEVITDLGE